MPNQPAQHETWSTRIGVILAVTGSAIGLGNFLRFPGLAAKYEGGAFMIPYFVAFLFLGLPLAWAEWATGRYGGARGFHSAAGIYRTIHAGPLSSIFGTLALIVPVVVYYYYVYIEAWCLGYAWYMLSGRLDLGMDRQKYIDFFDRFVGAGADGSAFAAGDGILVFLLLCVSLNLWIVFRGVTRGIEWCCRWAMPALVICALVVLARVLTLGTPDPSHPDWNVLNGLGFMWNPQTERVGFVESLLNAQMWIEAAGQIFFSLAVGFGIIITYASYLKPDDDIALSGLTAAAGNEFCEVALGGLITIPAAFVFLGPLAVLEVAGSTFNLGFKTLPMVFQAMPLGGLVGMLFFFLLFLAAVTSSVAMIQPAVALFEEGLGMRRRAAVSLLALITLVGTTFVVFFSKGLTALNTFDFWVGTFGIYLLATFQAILFGWKLGMRRGMAELDRGAEIRIPRIFAFLIKYVAPAYLLLVFGLWVYQQITSGGSQLRAVAEDPVAQLSVGFILLSAGLLGAIVHRSVRRWQAASLELSDFNATSGQEEPP